MKLLLLRCPKCNQALAPGQDDVVIQCPNCRAAVSITESGLALPAAQYVRPAGAEPAVWLPFWVYRSKVTMQARKTQGGRAGQDAETFWAGPRTVYVPAWRCDLQEARDLVQNLLEEQPHLEAMTRPEEAIFEPAVLTPQDARKLLELVIVTIEAERNDWMETLAFDLRLDSEALWLLPAVRQQDGWQLLVKYR